jgi:hypothetical protein
MVALACFFDWREALTVVKPETFLKRHRTQLLRGCTRMWTMQVIYGLGWTYIG